jgi:hypothetical protein
MRNRSSMLLLLCLFASLAGHLAGQESGKREAARARAALGKLPIYFIENRGVFPPEVAYYVKGADKTLFFAKDGVTFLLEGKDRGWTVKLDFVGANPDVRPCGEDRQQAVFSYFRGQEADWRTGLPTFRKVVYRDLWPGIDLVYRGTVNRLKYEFVVQPGADPDLIALQYRGAARLSLTEAGGLRVETPEGSFEDTAPFAYQEVDGERVSVEMAFDLDRKSEGPGGFGFRVGRFDRSRPLILDPAVLVYCGYVGGSGDDWGRGISVDAAGNAYVTGRTQSNQSSFPVTVGPNLNHNGTSPGDYDAFVAKVDAQGTKLLYCGYIGGTSDDWGYGISIDAAGNAYVTGYTLSTQPSFPVTVGPDLTYNGGNDAFVAKVNAKGTGLVYCGYIGGTGHDISRDISVDAAGNAYVTGWTGSNQSSFPVNVGPDLTHNGGNDVFVAKVKPFPNAPNPKDNFVYCGYIGGQMIDLGYGISVDAAGNALVTGSTLSDQSSFPVTVGPDLSHNGSNDAFVAKVNAAGNGLVYCGYIGGTGIDYGYGISFDAAGNAFVMGRTQSSESSFPVTVGPGLKHNGGDDAFVAKVNAAGNGLVYCGYIGGTGNDYGYGISVDAAGNAFVTGSTQSDQSSFPVTVGPGLTYNGGTFDAFMAKVDTAGNGLVYCGYIGGAGNDYGIRIAFDAAGNAYVAGYTLSNESSFPVELGPDLTYNGGTCDAFVAKVSLTLLASSGTYRPGTTVFLGLTASESAGLPYQLATSLGTGPIPIDTRQIGLSPDPLLWMSLSPVFSIIFQGYAGTISSQGQAQAAIAIPSITQLRGLPLHSAFVTLAPQAPSGIETISNTETFTIQ